MPTHQHPRDIYAKWARLGPLKRDARGRFARRNRGGPGRPPNFTEPPPDFVLPSGRIHPIYLNPHTAMALHDNLLRHDSPQNIDRLEQAKDLWQALLAETLCHGFTGEAWLHLKVSQGTIDEVRAHSRRSK